MSEVKKLAGQTIWYGMSTVVARMLNYLMTPLLTYFLVNPSEVIQYGTIGLIYSYFALLNVIFTYGMETAYFRFCAQEKDKAKSFFDTAFSSLIISSVIFCLLMYVFRQPIADFMVLGEHLNYIVLAIGILFFDTLQAIPFAKLRQQQQPRKYAFIRIMGVLINLLAVFFCLVLMPRLAAANPEGFWAGIISKYDVVSQVLFANLLQSVFTFLALFKEWNSFRFKLHPQLWQKMFQYSSPMILIGLAGVANEVIDRQFLIWYINGTDDYAKTIQGIYSANYKLSIVVTMFITAFRLAAEPFFFNKSVDKNAPEVFARVMKWFVITVCIAFLITSLYLSDIWLRFIGPSYRSGAFIVPILLMANIFSGIYYNLSVWYKIKDQMRMGVLITFIGAGITFLGNYLFIPQYEMLASAWTTLVCYAGMALLCYFIGQKYFPVPYPIKKIAGYLLLITLLYMGQHYIVTHFGDSSFTWLRLLTATLLIGLFLIIVIIVEKSELKTMPVIGRFIK